MMRLPKPDEATLLVRTDFSDQQAWQGLYESITTPNEDGFLPVLHIVDDPAYSGMSPAQVKTLLPPDQDLLFVADTVAQTESGQPVLAICTRRLSRRRRELRVIAKQLASIEANIRFANMDWSDFTESADDDGVFRGFWVPGDPSEAPQLTEDSGTPNPLGAPQTPARDYRL